MVTSLMFGPIADPWDRPVSSQATLITDSPRSKARSITRGSPGSEHTLVITSMNVGSRGASRTEASA